MFTFFIFLLGSYIIYSLGISLIVVIAGMAMSVKFTCEKEGLSPFECGTWSTQNSSEGLSLPFFLIGLIFLIFDIEITLMFPYLMLSSNTFSFTEISIFMLTIFILVVGLLWEWRLGMLDWAT